MFRRPQNNVVNDSIPARAVHLPCFIHIGEGGKQLEVFNAQMALAARLSRPVSVHCVKAYGKLVDILGGKDAGKNKKIINDVGNRDGSERAAAGHKEDGVDGVEEGVVKRLPPRIALQ